MERDKQAQAHC